MRQSTILPHMDYNKAASRIKRACLSARIAYLASMGHVETKKLMNGLKLSMAEESIEVIPSNGCQIHICTKDNCFFCYEMNRLSGSLPPSLTIKQRYYINAKKKYIRKYKWTKNTY